MVKFLVDVKEIWVHCVEVDVPEGSSTDEILEAANKKIEEGDDGDTEYSHTLDKDEWNVSPVVSKQLWLRFGDGSSYESFGEDFQAAGQAAYEAGVRLPLQWISTGFATDVFQLPASYVSCYWGDNGAQLIRSLTQDERSMLETEIKE